MSPQGGLCHRLGNHPNLCPLQPYPCSHGRSGCPKQSGGTMMPLAPALSLLWVGAAPLVALVSVQLVKTALGLRKFSVASSSVSWRSLIPQLVRIGVPVAVAAWPGSVSRPILSDERVLAFHVDSLEVLLLVPPQEAKQAALLLGQPQVVPDCSPCWADHGLSVVHSDAVHEPLMYSHSEITQLLSGMSVVSARKSIGAPSVPSDFSESRIPNRSALVGPG